MELGEGPESEAAAAAAGEDVKPIRLFGVDIYPSTNVDTAERGQKTQELIDFFSKEEPHFSDSPWNIRKDLIPDDLNHLTLPEVDVEDYILRLMDEEVGEQFQRPGTTTSLSVRVPDEDKGMACKDRRLVHYSGTGDYALAGGWEMICVVGDLNVKDKVGLHWDVLDNKLRFSVREKAPQLAPMELGRKVLASLIRAEILRLSSSSSSLQERQLNKE